MTAKRKNAPGAVHRLPADFGEAIESAAAARSAWAGITPLARNEWICWVASAKKDETRKRRIAVGLDKMRKGMRRPCCWPGCPHRGLSFLEYFFRHDFIGLRMEESVDLRRIAIDPRADTNGVLNGHQQNSQ